MVIHPDVLYIDRREWFDPTKPTHLLLGANWILRGTDQKWLIPVEVNEQGFLIEQPRD